MKIVSIDHHDYEQAVHDLILETKGGVRLTVVEEPKGLLSITADPVNREFINRLTQREVAISGVQVRIAGLRGVRLGEHTDDEALAVIETEVANVIYTAERRSMAEVRVALGNLRTFVQNLAKKGD